MTINTREDGLIEDVFEFPHEVYGTFRDALVMTSEEYNALSEAQISSMKQERFDKWAALIVEMSNTPSRQIDASKLPRIVYLEDV